jgi:hypothetical protein
MNGAIDSAAAKQRHIGRVHNCIDGECGDIAANDVDLHIHIFLHKQVSKNGKARRKPEYSNDETPGRSAFCHSDFVIPSAFDIRHCFVNEAFMARAGRLATRRSLATHNEGDRADDSDVPARIL